MATAASNVTATPFFMEAASEDTAIPYTAADMRYFIGSIWFRSGIIGVNALQITQSPVVGWSVTVQTGYAVVSLNLDNQRYLVHVEEPVTVQLTGFNTSPSGVRTHRVFLAVEDKLYQGNEYTAKVIVTEDTTGAGAPDPADAVTWVQLGTVIIAPGQANIQDGQINNSVRHAWMGGSASPAGVAITTNASILDAAADKNTRYLSATYRNGLVTLTGAVKRFSGNPFDPSEPYNLFSLNSGWRPANTRYQIAAASDGNYRLTINTYGTVQADIPAGHTPMYLFLDGVTYELD